jgi:hypothetical protein
MEKHRLWRTLGRVTSSILLIVLLAGMFPSSALTATGRYDETLGALSGPDSFSLSLWTVAAVAGKIRESIGAKPWAGLSAEQEKAIFDNFFASADQANQLEGQINDLANKGVLAGDPQLAELQSQLAHLRKARQGESAIVERLVEDQVQTVLKEQSIWVFDWGRIFLPPVFFKPIDLPDVLIVAYRDRIEMRTQVAVQRTMTVQEVSALESAVDGKLNVSSLVVPIGGYSTYPTMVSGTGPRDWMIGAVSHEWCHIYLTFYPLGQSYGKSGELSAMNETVCSLFGDEVSSLVEAQFYDKPQQPLSWQTPPQPAQAAPVEPAPAQEPQAFNSNHELSKIYAATEEKLRAGDISGAEAVMEEGRKYLAANGFYLRKLNQAFFAFYGSYAEGPNSIRPDPVGDDLRTLRRNSPSLRDFMQTVSKMSSFDDLKRAVEK